MPNRTYDWISPVPPPPGMTGLEAMRAVMRGEHPAPAIARTMDFTLIEVEEGSVLFACVPQEFHYNPIGLVHGGLAATLLDSCMGCAVHTTMPAGATYSTLELKVSYLKGITLETGRVLARGIVLQSGRSAAFAEGRLEDGKGRLLAHATTTCIVKR
ncbi:MAG TPA: PaaI family thioesterase [Myxococcales bacterium]|nr:PaaI family thioesterase [Myxococcales bacterium]